MTGIIVLAAGSSSRLGQAKQQLIFQGQTLLQRAVQAAVASEATPVVVVLGANAEAILPQIQTTPAEVVLNPDWAEGMASSIRVGVMHLQKISPACSAALFMLCDQPYASAELLNQLIAAHGAASQQMVACAYQNTLGAPVLFPRKFFPYLLLLQGPEGAKKLLSRFPDQVISIPFPAGAIDIDTPSDYESLTANEA